jgi:hypothetical protein
MYEILRDEVTGEWRKHIEELHDQYTSPTIVWLINSRRMRWAGNLARMEEGRGVYKVLVGKPEGKRPMGRQGVDERIRLRWIFRKLDVGLWTGLSWLRIKIGGGHL